MARNVVAVDNERQRNLRVKPNPDLAHVKDQHLISLAVTETGPAANDYPLALVKFPDSGQHRLVALFGLKTGQNVFYGMERWSSSYMPLVVVAHPFVLGRDESNPDPTRLTTCIDLESPYVDAQEGQPLFLEDGTDSDLLEQGRRVLGQLFEGERRTRVYVETLENLDLIRDFELRVQHRSGQTSQITGLSTIDEQAFNALGDDKVLELYNAGFVAPMILMLNSLGQFHRLVRLYNGRADDPIAKFQMVPDGQTSTTEPAS
jgi:hypothetical protein